MLNPETRLNEIFSSRRQIRFNGMKMAYFQKSVFFVFLIFSNLRKIL